MSERGELRQRAMAEIPCHDPFSWISPEEVIALLDELKGYEKVVEPAREWWVSLPRSPDESRALSSMADALHDLDALQAKEAGT